MRESSKMGSVREVQPLEGGPASLPPKFMHAPRVVVA
jgi:hypothetical protein